MDGATDSEFGVLPWIDSLEGVDRSMAAKFGERSLFLRGLLQPRLDEPEGLASLVPSDELRLAADARRNGDGVDISRRSRAERGCSAVGKGKRSVHLRPRSNLEERHGGLRQQ